jgi:hypothetical protein
MQGNLARHAQLSPDTSIHESLGYITERAAFRDNGVVELSRRRRHPDR